LSFPHKSRSSIIRIVVRQSAHKPTKHDGSDTQRSDARFAFNEH
jgi:hypothetical protein